MKNNIILQGKKENKKVMIEVKNLTIGYGDFIVLKDVSFNVSEGEIFAILGSSGCGKSSMIKHMIGLMKPIKGNIVIDGIDIIHFEDYSDLYGKKFGVLYQSGALFSSMTLLENVMIQLKEFTSLPDSLIESIARVKLAQVGLNGYEDFYPHEISGGMKKRGGIARAMALDPKILFLDEPSAGLDPITSTEIDELILSLKKDFGTTMVIVTHELDSVFAIADRVVVLDKSIKGVGAEGDPNDLKRSSGSLVKRFLTRGYRR